MKSFILNCDFNCIFLFIILAPEIRISASVLFWNRWRVKNPLLDIFFAEPWRKARNGFVDRRWQNTDWTFCTNTQEQQPLCLQHNFRLTENQSKSLKNTDEKLPVCSTSVEGLMTGVGAIESLTYIDENDSSQLLPPWANLTLAYVGQKFAIKNSVPIGLSAIHGLTSLLSVKPIADSLISTGKSNTPGKAARRYAATIVQVFFWLRSWMNDKERLYWMLRSLAKVRKIHRKFALKTYKQEDMKDPKDSLLNMKLNKNLWKAFEKDLENSPVDHSLRQISPTLDKAAKLANKKPYNQFLIALTQWAFIGMLFARPKALLLQNYKTEDVEGFVHLWGILAYAMGVEDRYNVALQPNLCSLQVYMDEMLNRYVLPSLFNISPLQQRLMQAYIYGSAEVFLGSDPEWFLRGLLRDGLGLATPNLEARRGPRGVTIDMAMTKALPNLLTYTNFSMLVANYHYKIGLRYFGPIYLSDKELAEQCYYS